MQRLDASGGWPSDMPVTMALNDFVPKICRLPSDYLYRDDPAAMVETSLLVHEWLDIDSIAIAHDGYNFEFEAMGGKLRYFPDFGPDVDRTDYFVKNGDDLEKVRFKGLGAGRYPYLIECYSIAEKHFGLKLFPAMCGPWSLACSLYGVENLLVAALAEPGFVHALLDKIVADVLVPTARALKGALPGDANIVYTDAWRTTPYINAELYREFIIPHYAKWADMLAPEFTLFGAGLRRSGSSKEDQEYFWHEMTTRHKTGVIRAQEPDLTYYGAEFFRREGDRQKKPVVLLASPALIVTNTPEGVAGAARRLCLIGKNGATHCTVGLGNTGGAPPLINLFTFIKACRVYGSVGADENTPFSIPYDFQSFEEFLKAKLEANVERYSFGWLGKSGYSYMGGR